MHYILSFVSYFIHPQIWKQTETELNSQCSTNRDVNVRQTETVCCTCVRVAHYQRIQTVPYVDRRQYEGFFSLPV